MKKIKLLFNDPKEFAKKILRKLGIFPPSINKSSHLFDPLEQYTHLIHTGENVTGLSHLDLWAPQFLKADITFVIMTRNYMLFNAAKEKYPEATILFAKTTSDLSYYMKWMVWLKACFYPSNTGNNLHPLAYNDLTHIFIGHGDSDKAASAHKFFRVYDENWVAGEAHIDRFKNEGFDFQGLEQVKIGRPSLEETLKLSEVPWRERFDGELRLLYLSTWEGFFNEQNYTSAYMMQSFFEQVFDVGVFEKIDVKLHPGIGRRDESLLALPDNIIRIFSDTKAQAVVHSKDVPVETLIKKSNVFICDISAVISESLAADAPIFVYIPKDRDIKLTQSKMTYTDYTYIFSTVEELLRQIDDVIVKGNDHLATKRKEAMEYILGKNETLQECFIERLEEI